MHTRNILFEQQREAHQALFENPYDLARRMIVWGIRGEAGKERNLGSHLTQVVTYNKRGYPPELRNELRAALLKRCDELRVGPQNVERLTHRLAVAIDADEAARRSPGPLSADVLYFDLLTLSEEAVEQFIITTQPAEVVLSVLSDFARAKTLSGILLRRLGLSALLDGATREPDTSYVFNFPDEDLGRDFWTSLFESLLGSALEGQLDIGEEDIKKALQKLEDDRKLLVQVIPKEMCSAPTVIFDPLMQGARAYNLYYHPQVSRPGRDAENLVSVAELDRNSLKVWKQLIWRPIREGSVGVIPVPFKKKRNEEL